MRYRITHRTEYEYDHPVSVSHHRAHLRPRQLPWQDCVAHRVTVDPVPAAWSVRDDYYGNEAVVFAVEGAHRILEVVAESEVVVSAPAAVPTAGTPAWEEVREGCRGDRLDADTAAAEFLHDSPLVRRDALYAAYAATSFPARRPVVQGLADLTSRIHRDFRFDPRSTTVATPLEEVYARRRGVCQDFAHFGVACLRSLGLPARYVSGYLETVPPPGKPRLVGADASHAWISAWVPGTGWVDFDPTNNLRPGERHITVAWGRDFSDVSPIRGVIVGCGEHALKVSVDVEPVPADPVIPGAPGGTGVRRTG